MACAARVAGKIYII